MSIPGMCQFAVSPLRAWVPAWMVRVIKRDGQEKPTMIEKAEEDELGGVCFKRKALVLNTEVIENLGQIDLMVADKTGTITINELVLRHAECSPDLAECMAMSFRFQALAWTRGRDFGGEHN